MLELVQELFGLQVPEPHRPVYSAGQGATAVRKECDRLRHTPHARAACEPGRDRVARPRRLPVDGDDLLAPRVIVTSSSLSVLPSNVALKR